MILVEQLVHGGLLGNCSGVLTIPGSAVFHRDLLAMAGLKEKQTGSLKQVHSTNRFPHCGLAESHFCLNEPLESTVFTAI